MTRAHETTPALEVRDVRKSFGGVHALRGINLWVRPGEVLGLVGDNGAGKSTLVKCISGMHQPDEGQILVDGVPCVFESPHQARELGIETVYQDLSLIETFDVPANLFLNREIYRGGALGRSVRWLNQKQMRAETAEVLERLRINIPSFTSPVSDMSGGQRQAVAVARAIAWGRHIVLLDEPAAALGVEQSELVLRLVESLAEQGVAVIFISHNMQHVLRSTHRVIVLRHGEKVAETQTAATTIRDLVGYITGAPANLDTV